MTSFFCLASGGIGLFSIAKSLMMDQFSKALPLIVTASFSTSYILMISCGNMSGRIIWSGLSDKIGRKAIFNLYTFGSIPLFALLPFCITQV